MLNSQQIAFINQIKDKEELSNISFLLNAATVGTDLHSTQIDQILEHCEELRTNSMAEGSDLPKFVDMLWDLFNMISMTGGKGSDILTQQNQADPYFSPGATPEPVRKKKEPRLPSSTPKTPRVKEDVVAKYSNTEITTENIPPYLLEISQIIDKIVAAKCADVVKENAELKAQLAKIQALIGGK